MGGAEPHESMFMRSDFGPAPSDSVGKGCFSVALSTHHALVDRFSDDGTPACDFPVLAGRIFGHPSNWEVLLRGIVKSVLQIDAHVVKDVLYDLKAVSESFDCVGQAVG